MFREPCGVAFYVEYDALAANLVVTALFGPDVAPTVAVKKILSFLVTCGYNQRTCKEFYRE